MTESPELRRRRRRGSADQDIGLEIRQRGGQEAFEHRTIELKMIMMINI